jgi:hypothetical protein
MPNSGAKRLNISESTDRLYSEAFSAVVYYTRTIMKWPWAWKEVIVAYFKVLYRHFPENELQCAMKIPQDNRPPDRFELKTRPAQSPNNSTTTFGISVLNLHSACLKVLITEKISYCFRIS